MNGYYTDHRIRTTGYGPPEKKWYELSRGRTVFYCVSAHDTGVDRSNPFKAKILIRHLARYQLRFLLTTACAHPRHREQRTLFTTGNRSSKGETMPLPLKPTGG